MGAERYHPLFADDLARACHRYDDISPTLGRRFRDHVRSLIATIIKRPASFGRIGGDYRGGMVRDFPYVIVYIVDESVLTFYGLRHAASDRGDWFTRDFSG